MMKFITSFFNQQGLPRMKKKSIKQTDEDASVEETERSRYSVLCFDNAQVLIENDLANFESFLDTILECAKV